jgi:type IV secretory pathway TraG/TraD family ATPase VirD4
MNASIVWVAAIAAMVWAVVAGNRMLGDRHQARIKAAQKPSGALKDAKFGSTELLQGVTGGIRLAYDKVTGALLRYPWRDGHGLIVGATGSGKSRDWLIAAVLDLAGRASMILIDMSGATTAQCYRHLSSFGKVVVCNPFENDETAFPMKLAKSTPYNPLASLKPGKPGFTLGCKRLAVLMSGDNDTSNNENSAHFKERAESLIAGVIMFVCEKLPEKERHLGVVRDIITSAHGRDFWECAEDAKHGGSRFCKQRLAAYAERTDDGEFRGKNNKEVADVLATAARYTEFIGNEDIGPSLESDGFRFAPLKDDVGVVSLICPLERMHDDGGKWLKIMVASALQELLRNGRGKKPVYLFLDESDQYSSPIIHAALNIARKFGVVLIVMVQQLSDIEVRYGKQWNAFVNGTAWKIFYASDCLKTREYVEKLCGTKSVRVHNITIGDGEKGSSPSTAFVEQSIPLMAGFEVGLVPPDECLLKVSGIEVIEAKRKPYWECKEPEIEGKWDKDPYEEVNA